jgi:chromosome segregation ATPase
MTQHKTRREINAEMLALRDEITQMQADHAAKVTALESTVSALTGEIEQAKAALAEADAVNAAKVEEIATMSASLESMKAELTAEQEARAETEAGLAKAKAALGNPAFLDASLIPHSVDQQQADAEADKAETDAENKANQDQTKLSILEQYESMPQGETRRAFYAKHKPEIFRQMAEREGE